MTSFTKLEISQHRQCSGEPQSQPTCIKVLVKFYWVVSQICEQTDKQTDRQADETLIAILRTFLAGEVIRRLV